MCKFTVATASVVLSVFPAALNYLGAAAKKEGAVATSRIAAKQGRSILNAKSLRSEQRA